MFDLTISPLFVDAGREQPELPGLFVALAPRKAARLRVRDQLLMYMKVSDPSVLKPAQQQEILTKLAETYFNTSGPITTGLRAVVVRLNDFLLNRNLRSAREGQTIAVLGLGAVHSGTLLLAHGGATHSFLIGKNQVQHFDEGQGVRGLGLGKQIVPRFYQSSIEAGDVLVFCAEPPSGWLSKSLAGTGQGGLESLRRRLLSQSGAELHAGMIRFQNGKGQVTWLRPSSADRSALAASGKIPPAGQVPASQNVASQPVVSQQSVQPMPSPLVAFQPPASEPPLEKEPVEPVTASQRPVSEKPAVSFAETGEGRVEPPALPAHSLETEDTASTISSEAAAGKPEPAQAQGTSAAAPIMPVEPQLPAAEKQRVETRATEVFRKVNSVTTETPSQTPSRPAPSALGSSRPRAGSTEEIPAVPPHKPKPAARVSRPAGPNPVVVKFGKALSNVFRSGAAARAKTGQAVAGAFGKAFPNRSESLFNLSPAVFITIAIFVPLLIVSLAVAIYLYTGRAEQMALNLYYAQEYANQAAQQTDPKNQREYWNQVILWVRRADELGASEQGKALRQQAWTALDTLDGVVRMEYQPVIVGGLGADVNITHMVATLNDAYLLDSSQGRIIRLYRTGTGYAFDPNFTCGPGKAGGQIIGPLIDLATLPPNNEYRATVMGIDAGGNLVYCSTAQSGYDSRALTAPDTNWGKIIGITTYGDTLYVLDPDYNAVWYYTGSKGLYEQRPRLFFDSQVPQMDDIIDFTVDQEFLYLLHADGRMTLCEGSGFEFQATRCNDPVPYGDPRTGRTPSPLRFEDARFIQLQSTQPPDPSLFILDDAGAAIYHFSLRRLNFQRQYRGLVDADYPLPDELPTAFVVTPNRRVLLAYKNQVFTASIP